MNSPLYHGHIQENENEEEIQPPDPIAVLGAVIFFSVILGLCCTAKLIF